jgi:hypothetical protein
VRRPADGGARGEAERVGQDGGGDFGGELQERGRPLRAAVDAECVEASAQVLGVLGLAGVAASEEPLLGGGYGGAGSGLAAVRELADELAERVGHQDEVVGEAEVDRVVVDCDGAGP